MSWKTVNRILGQAAIDPAFRQELQEDPLATLGAEGFQLTSEEQEVFLKFHLCLFLSSASACWKNWPQKSTTEGAGKLARKPERRNTEQE